MEHFLENFSFLNLSESALFYFFSTASQCVAAVAGLSAALSTFHYQNLLGRIREMRDRLYEKYDPIGAGLRSEYQDQYKRCRTLEDHVDFWRSYFEKEDRGGHQHVAFDDLTDLIKKTRSFRFMVVRVNFYGFGLLLPLGVVGTLLPTVTVLGGVFRLALLVAYLGLFFFYLAMNLTLTRAVFIAPWPKR